MIVPDLNLLLYAHRIQDPNHIAARHWWQELVGGSEEIRIPWVVAIGFIRLTTHPNSAYDPLPIDVAVQRVSDWLRIPHIEPIEPGTGHLRHLSRNLDATGVGGNLVTDAHIAAIALENDAEVHTNDFGFRRFPGLRWHNPLQTAAT